MWRNVWPGNWLTYLRIKGISAILDITDLFYVPLFLFCPIEEIKEY